jgi:hypothetical protein
MIGMNVDDIPKTTSFTQYRMYTFIVIPFGLKYAPTRFQCFVHAVLMEYVEKGREGYMRDILIKNER